MTYQSHYFQEAREAQSRAYVPYSNFKVGAYLKTKDGRTFYGANVENAAYPATICAERSSLVAAISEGYRPGDFESITVTVDSENRLLLAELVDRYLKNYAMMICRYI